MFQQIASFILDYIVFHTQKYSILEIFEEPILPVVYENA